jgi:uncharacterized protein (TIGR00730 family)
MNISIFGGSQPKPGDAAYLQASNLGRRLGEAGHTVLTGGYIGTMEATSRGAYDAGGHVIGVTCDQIETWRPVRPNEWIHEEWRYPTIRQRLYKLIEACDAAIALPGGIGTLAEISMLWSHLQTQSLTPKPLILVGPGWQSLFSDFYSTFDNYINEQDKRILSFAPDVDKAIEALNNLDEA